MISSGEDRNHQRPVRISKEFAHQIWKKQKQNIMKKFQKGSRTNPTLIQNWKRRQCHHQDPAPKCPKSPATENSKTFSLS